jgi:hypothetical protein
MHATFPGEGKIDLGESSNELDYESTRLDLDDLGGEIILLDWGKKKYKNHPVSKPNRSLMQHRLMNGDVYAIIHQESKSTNLDRQLYHRMTRLSRNELIKPLTAESADPI